MQNLIPNRSLQSAKYIRILRKHETTLCFQSKRTVHRSPYGRGESRRYAAMRAAGNRPYGRGESRRQAAMRRAGNRPNADVSKQGRAPSGRGGSRRYAAMRRAGNRPYGRGEPRRQAAMRRVGNRHMFLEWCSHESRNRPCTMPTGLPKISLYAMSNL